MKHLHVRVVHTSYWWFVGGVKEMKQIWDKISSNTWAKEKKEKEKTHLNQGGH